MRAFAALLLLASLAKAAQTKQNHDNLGQNSNFQSFTDKLISSAFRYLDTRQDLVWPDRVVKCGRTLGVAKCIKAFSAWRAEEALFTLATDSDPRFDVKRDLDYFPWERFANSSDVELDERLSEGASQLLRYRSLNLDIFPGYQLELDSKRNGTLNVDVCSTSEGESRGMGKKMRKQFYRIVPFLLLPGLFMAAVLPFVLPALKMMTVGVGILNNMALSGAIFTLLRNNAFDDKYTKKVIYVNEGYKNEKFSHHHHNGPYGGYGAESQDGAVYYADEDSGYNSMPVPPAEWLFKDAVEFNNNNYKIKRNDNIDQEENGEKEPS